jgi:HK97 family phage prohead protease
MTVLNGDITRSIELETLEVQGAEGRTLVARLLRWDVENEVTDDGKTYYTEIWERGSFASTIKRAEQTGRKWPMFINHRRADPPIGAIATIHERADGPWMTAKVSNTSGGNDALELYKDGALTSVSVGATVLRSRRVQKAVHRMEVAVREVSLTPFNQLSGAEIVALRSHEATRQYVDDLDAFLAQYRR